MDLTPKDADDDSIHIRDMWNENLEEEFVLIREIVDWYNYVAMDTEFPGVVLRPIGSFKNINDYNYQNLKENIDMLKLIQLGLTFSDEDDNKLFDIAGISVFDIDQSVIGDGVCRDWGEDYI